MGRVVGKSSCDYMMLHLSSRKLEAVTRSKQAFLEIDPDQGPNTDDVEATPADLKKYMNTDRVPIRVMPCRCRSKCPLKRLREKHGNYMDCTIYYM